MIKILILMRIIIKMKIRIEKRILIILLVGLYDKWRVEIANQIFQNIEKNYKKLLTLHKAKFKKDQLLHLIIKMIIYKKFL